MKKYKFQFPVIFILLMTAIIGGIQVFNFKNKLNAQNKFLNEIVWAREFTDSKQSKKKLVVSGVNSSSLYIVNDDLDYSNAKYVTQGIFSDDPIISDPYDKVIFVIPVSLGEGATGVIIANEDGKIISDDPFRDNQDSAELSVINTYPDIKYSLRFFRFISKTPNKKNVILEATDDKKSYRFEIDTDTGKYVKGSLEKNL